jgi:energy-converting hydrogenase Eha subunit B
MLGQHYRRVVRPSEGGLAVRYYAPHAALSADNSALLSSASVGACILGLALFTLLGALTQRLCVGQPVRGLLAAGAVAALVALGHALVMLPTLGTLIASVCL